MLKEKIFSLSLSAVALSLLSSPFSASAQRQGQYAEELQQCMNFETQARSTNTADGWRTAGTSWMSQGSFLSVNTNHQDWVKDTLNTGNHDVSVAIMKRSIGCFLKAYELEGAHDTPQSRARSQSLRNLSQAYSSLCNVDSKNSDWYYLRGELNCSKGMYKQSVPDLNKAVALGGMGGAKASALLAHTKPYLAHQLAADHALWVHNEAVDNYNAAHYHPTPVTTNTPRYSDLYIRTGRRN